MNDTTSSPLWTQHRAGRAPTLRSALLAGCVLGAVMPLAAAAQEASTGDEKIIVLINPNSNADTTRLMTEIAATARDPFRHSWLLLLAAIALACFPSSAVDLLSRDGRSPRQGHRMLRRAGRLTVMRGHAGVDGKAFAADPPSRCNGAPWSRTSSRSRSQDPEERARKIKPKWDAAPEG